MTYIVFFENARQNMCEIFHGSALESRLLVAFHTARFELKCP
jgi:hypothetical protein